MKRKLNLMPLTLFLVMVLTGGLSAFAADIIASGTVVDTESEPLIGVSVGVKGAPGMGTSTDIDGNFRITVPDGSILVFSYVGCATKEMKAAPGMDVVLQADSSDLDEVVVIGYGAVKRKDLTTAVSTVERRRWPTAPSFQPPRLSRVRLRVWQCSSPRVLPAAA